MLTEMRFRKFLWGHFKVLQTDLFCTDLSLAVIIRKLGGRGGGGRFITCKTWKFHSTPGATQRGPQWREQDGGGTRAEREVLACKGLGFYFYWG